MRAGPLVAAIAALVTSAGLVWSGRAGASERPGGDELPVLPVLPVLVVEGDTKLSPDAPEPEPPLRARLFGRVSERMTMDLDWRGDESVFEARSRLTLGLSYESSPWLSFAVEGRLEHRLRLSDAPFSDNEGAEASIEAELRRLLMTWRSERGPELAFGLQTIRWGKTSLTRPLDLVSPVDWRDGPGGPLGRERQPVVALAGRFSLGKGQLELLYLPFFVPARVPLIGESAPERVFATTPDAVDEVARWAVSRDLSDRPGPRQDLVTSGELGVRLTQRFGPLELGLAWHFGRDRVPGPNGHERRNAVGLDLATRLGPLKVAGEVALLADRRLVRSDLASERHLGVDWAFEVQAAPTVFLDLTVGLGGRVVPGASGDFLGAAPSETWLDLGLSLLLAFDGVLRLDTELKVELERESHVVFSGLAARLGEGFELSAGVLVYGGDPSRGGLWALYREQSHAWLQAELVF